MNKNESVFREKSLKKISNPDQLNQYIRVSNVGVWMVIAAVIVALVGLLFWACFGHVDSYVAAAAEVKDGNAVIYCGYNDVMQEDFTVKCIIIGGNEFEFDTNTEVDAIEATPEFISRLNPDIQYNCNFVQGQPVYVFECASPGLRDRMYSCKLILETYTPIKFIIN